MTFEISALSFKDTFDLQLRNPATQEPLYGDSEKTRAVSILLYGPSSKQFRNAKTAMQNRQLKRMQKKEKPSMEVTNEESLTLLVACTASMNELSVAGKIPTTEADFRELYSTPAYSWIKDQVDEALADNTNFLPQ